MKRSASSLVTNGDVFVPFVPTQDHKRVFDGDQVRIRAAWAPIPMGAFSVNEQTEVVLERIMLPTLAQMRKGNALYRIFVRRFDDDLDGPKILEFNVRMGDPETQAILHGY